MAEILSGPYVGVSGFGVGEYPIVAELFGKQGIYELGRQGMIGCKVTSRTLRNRPTSRGDMWFPPAVDLPELVGEQGHTGGGRRPVAVAQLYADQWGNKAEAFCVVDGALTATESWLGGVQLDLLPWMREPRVAEAVLSRIKNTRPDLPIILQAHAEIMASDERAVVNRIRDMSKDSLIDHVLFDGSGGRGRLIEPNVLRWLHVTTEVVSGVGLAVAGGLGPYTMDRVLPFAREHPGISWDAETNLHRGMHNNALNMPLVEAYLARSACVLESASFANS